MLRRLESSLLAVVVLALSSVGVGAVPTFTKDVAPILFKHCANCHDELLSYDAVRSSSKAIREQVRARAMPPWPADPARSLKFRNDARLSEPDIATVVAWIDAGTPKGDDTDLRAVPAPAGQWQNPEGRPPDTVVPLPVIHVGPTGEVPYIQQLIKVPVAEDKWIVAMQLLPGNLNLLHHMGITEVALPEGMGPAQINEFAAIARKYGIPDGSDCPDACPAGLFKLAWVMKQLGQVAAHVQVLFITLDPERDTPASLKSYVSAFDPRFIGLTGTSAQIDQAASGFNVQYARVPLGNDYTIDHSTAIFLFDGAGRLRRIGATNSPVADFVHDITELVAK